MIMPAPFPDQWLVTLDRKSYQDNMLAMFTWCRDNCTGGWYSCRGREAVRFTNLEDAMLFELTWGS
jgi:hypothetical protein